MGTALIVGTHLLAMVCYYLLPRVCATMDYKAILANGSKDSLHGTFHRQRATWRGLAMVGVAMVCSLPSLYKEGWEAGLLQAMGFVVVGACYFAYDFNPRLSRLRGLDPWYVSADSRAALFDRFLYKQGWHLRTVLRWVLAVGLAVYVGATIAATTA